MPATRAALLAPAEGAAGPVDPGAATASADNSAAGAAAPRHLIARLGIGCSSRWEWKDTGALLADTLSVAPRRRPPI
ncbi:MAG TPA: hypothetical protein VF380_07275, partial [Solirubrobacteraceae bacterium]